MHQCESPALAHHCGNNKHIHAREPARRHAQGVAAELVCTTLRSVERAGERAARMRMIQLAHVTRAVDPPSRLPLVTTWPERRHTVAPARSAAAKLVSRDRGASGRSVASLSCWARRRRVAGQVATLTSGGPLDGPRSFGTPRPPPTDGRRAPMIGAERGWCDRSTEQPQTGPPKASNMREFTERKATVMSEAILRDGKRSD